MKTVLVSQADYEALLNSKPTFPDNLPPELPSIPGFSGLIKALLINPVKSIFYRMMGAAEKTWEELNANTLEEKWNAMATVFNENKNAILSGLKQKANNLREAAATAAADEKEKLEAMADAIGDKIDSLHADFGSEDKIKDFFKGLLFSSLPKLTWPVFPVWVLIKMLKDFAEPKLEAIKEQSQAVKDFFNSDPKENAQDSFDKMKLAITDAVTNYAATLSAPVVTLLNQVKTSIETNAGNLDIDKDDEAGEKMKKVVKDFIPDLSLPFLQIMKALAIPLSESLMMADTVVNTQYAFLPYRPLTPVDKYGVPIGIVEFSVGGVPLKFLYVPGMMTDDDYKKYTEMKFKYLSWHLRKFAQVLYMYNGIIPPDVPDVRVVTAKIAEFGDIPDKLEAGDKDSDGNEIPGSAIEKTLEKFLKTAKIRLPTETGQFTIDGSFSELLKVEFAPDKDAEDPYDENTKLLAASVTAALTSTGVLGATPVPATMTNGSTGIATMVGVIAT